MPKKLNILIDSNALSNLSSVEINHEKPHTWLWRYFNIYTTESVVREFLKGVRNRGANEKGIGRKIKNNKKIIPKLYNLNKLEERWLNELYYEKTLSDEDKGERHLICTAVELIKKQNFAQIVLVTDDDKAYRTFLAKIKDDISFGEIWSSLDLITYLYFVFTNISYYFAENAIIDIVSNVAIGWKEYKQKGYSETDARILMKKKYIKKLKNIEKLKIILN